VIVSTALTTWFGGVGTSTELSVRSILIFLIGRHGINVERKRGDEKRGDRDV